jgi:hypothetical protein
MNINIPTRRNILFVIAYFFSAICFGQNIFSGEPIQVVGQMNGYSTSSSSNSVYRKLSTTTSNPSDGRGQWVKSYNVQNSGGDFTPINMTGGAPNGLLFISGPSGNRFQNKWTFSSVSAASLNIINSISSYSNSGAGVDMGLNMNSTGRYTFVFNDAGYTNTNAKFCVSYTAAAPITLTRSSQTINANSTSTIGITTSASPSIGENIYVRYTTASDFSSTNSSSIVQATGSGTNWTANIPAQASGSVVKYYVFSSTVSSLASLSETDKSLAAINFDDNSGANYSYNSTATQLTSTLPNNTYCGSATNVSFEINGPNIIGATSYLWQSGADTTVGVSNIIGETGSYLGAAIINIPIKYFRRISNNGDTSSWLKISLRSLPLITNPTSYNICSGTSTSINLSANTPSTFAWTIGTNTGSVSGASASNGDSINQILTNPSNSTVGSIIYNVTPTSNVGSCVGSPTAITVTVRPRPAMTYPSTTWTCSGTNTTMILTASSASTFAWTLGTNIGSITGATAGSGSVLNTILTNPSNASVGSIIFNVTPISTVGSCSGSVFPITVTVNPAPSVTNSNSAAICSGTSPNITLTASAASTFAWTLLGTNPGSISGASAGNGSSINQTLTNPSNANAGSINYNVTPTSTNGSCIGSPTLITVTVNPRPAITNSSTASICSGTSPNISLTASATSTFTWTLGTNTGSISGASASNGNSINQTLINPSNANVGSIIYNVTPTSIVGSCAGTNFPITVNVNPTPAITNSNTASICSGTSPNITLTASAASTFAWTLGTNTGSISGASASNGSSINQTLTNPSNTNIGSVIYNITPTSTTGSCVGSPTAITVTVNPIPAVTNSNTTTICSGTSPNITLAASATSTFAWTLGTNTGSISGASASSGSSINQTLTNPSNANTGSIIYNVTPTSTTGSCVGNPTAITVTVNPRPAITNSNTATICSITSPNITLAASATSTFTWTLGTNTGSIAGSSASNGSSINQTLTNPSNTSVGSIIYNITPTSTSGSCVGSPTAITVTVNPRPLMTSSSSQTVCSGVLSSVNLTASTTGGTNTFTWSTIGNSNLSGFASSGAISTIGAHTITTGAATAQNLLYSITPTYTNNSVSCAGTSQNYTYTINPIPVVNNSSSQTVCSSVSSSVSLTANTSGGTNSFIWSTSGNSNLAGFAASGTTSTIGTHTIINSATTSQNLNYSITPTYINNSVSCSGTSQNYTYTINPKPILTSSTSQTICSGISSSILLTSNTTGGTNSFTWSTIGNSNLSGFIVNDTTIQIGSHSIINNASTSQNLVYKIIPRFTLNSVTCSGSSSNFTYTINPRPIVNSPISQTVCTGVPSSVSITANTSGGSNSFTWVTQGNSNLTNYLPNGTSNSIGSHTILNSSSTPQDLIYSITPTFTNNSVSCSGANSNYTLIINPRPSLVMNGSQTICSGISSSVNLIANTSGGSNTFVWSTPGNTKLSSYLTGAATSIIGTHTIINNDFTNQNLVYNIIPTFTNNGVSCIGTNAIYTYTVNPIPNVYFDDSINFGSSKQVICSGTNFKTTQFKTDYDFKKVRFDWNKTNLTTIQGLKDTGSGNIFTAVLINNQNNSDSVTYSIVPRFTYNNVTCSGNSISTKITVNPKPQITGALSQTICNGASTSVPLNVNTNRANTTISWNTSGNPKLSSYLTGDTTFIIGPHKIYNNDTATQNLVYKIIPTYKNNGRSCIGDTANYTYNVLSTPVPVASFTYTQSRGNVLFTPSQSGLTYKWYFGDGDSSILSNPTHSYKSNGVYNVKLIVENSNSCSNDTTIMISQNTVGIDNLERQILKMYPNPTLGNIIIESHKTISTIDVLDITGKSVSHHTNISHLDMINLDLSALANGVYFISAQNVFGNRIMEKVLIQK